MTTIAPSIDYEDLVLENGDRMSQQEFHRRYLRSPKNFHAELIGGIVHVASPLKLRHGRNHLPLGSLLFAYESNTPGTESSDNTTVILSDDSEPQPDLFLRILPEFGGKSITTATGYVKGPPELIIEIAHSSKAIDLHAKRDDYRKNHVVEYLVACVKDRQLHTFDFVSGKEPVLVPGDVCKSTVFPGLWIDVGAVFDRDFNTLIRVLNEGIATAEHRGFVEKLKKAKRKSK